MAETPLLQRLRERKLVQWALAYLAAAWVLVEATSVVVDQFHLPSVIGQGVTVLALFGFFVVVVLAWFHGEKGRQRVSGPELVLVAGLLVLAGMALSALPGSEGSADRTLHSAGESNRTAIAVLPLRNLSPEGPHSYFASSLYQELLTQLAKVADIRLTGRMSVMGYGETADPREIAQELGVGTVVQGSVQVVEDSLRVHIQVIDGATGRLVRPERFDGALGDAFAIQTDIAGQIVDAVGSVLTEAEARAIAAAGTENSQAYQFYLQGREYFGRAGNLSENLQIAQDLFEQAVEADPDFALAYAALSRLHGIALWYAYDPSDSRREAQRTAAEMALRLAPELPEAQEAMIYVYYYGELDYERALGEALSVQERLPGLSDGWSTIGYLHRRLGQWDAVLAAYEEALIRDPRNESVIGLLGGDTFKFLHRFEDAIEAFDRALIVAPDYHLARLKKAWTLILWTGDMGPLREALINAPVSYGARGSSDRWRVRLALWERDPDRLFAVLRDPGLVTYEARLGYEPGLLFAAWAHLLRGDDARAREAFEGALTQLDSVSRELPNDWRVSAGRGLALAGLGRQPEAERECLKVRASPVYSDPFTRPVLDEACAMIFAQAGMEDEAVAELEALIEKPSWTSAAMISLDPRWDPVRDHPRYRTLMERWLQTTEG